MPVPVPSQKSSKFFPPPYKLQSDGPPISMRDAAEQRLQSITQGLPDLVQVQQEHLSLLNHSPGYAAFFLTSFDRYERLLKAKPVLIQGRLSSQGLLRNLSVRPMPELYIYISSRMCRARPMEAPRCSYVPQQDCGTRSIARILDAHGTLADTRIACPRSACLFFYFFLRSHSGRDRVLYHSL